MKLSNADQEIYKCLINLEHDWRVVMFKNGELNDEGYDWEVRSDAYIEQKDDPKIADEIHCWDINGNDNDEINLENWYKDEIDIYDKSDYPKIRHFGDTGLTPAECKAFRDCHDFCECE